MRYGLELSEFGLSCTHFVLFKKLWYFVVIFKFYCNPSTFSKNYSNAFIWFENYILILKLLSTSLKQNMNYSHLLIFRKTFKTSKVDFGKKCVIACAKKCRSKLRCRLKASQEARCNFSARDVSLIR